MRKKEFLTGVVSLSLAMLIVQSTSMGFSVYISSKLGAEEMGLFHLIMSVFSFAVTVATSGIPLASTRLVSEEKSVGVRKSILRKCVILSLGFSFFASFVLVGFAPKIATHLIKMPRTQTHIKILGACLPFIAVSGAVRGYFIGIQKVSMITVSKMAEEFSSIFIMLVLFKLPSTRFSGALIPVIATSVSSAFACLCDSVMYKISTSKYKTVSKGVGFSPILSISLPVGAGSYLRSGLTSTENLIIPASLSKYGSSNGLAGYGMVKAMAMPVIMFPYVFLQSFTSLLVPEVSSRKANIGKKSVYRVSLKSLKFTLVFSSAIAVTLLIFGRKLALSLYGDLNAGYYITALALLAIPMYIDTVTDSLLKGLNEQVYSLKINIVDSILRVPLIYFILPYTGVYGYIGVLYVSEILNLTMSMRRLNEVFKKTLA